MTAARTLRPDEETPRVHLSVRHVTELMYGGEASEAHSEVRKTPVDTGLQRVVTTRIDVQPSAVLKRHEDYYGNVVHHFDLLEAHGALCIAAESVVETSDAVACGPGDGEDARSGAERWAEFLHPSTFVPDLAEYGGIAHGVAPGLDGEAFLAALEDLGATLKRDFRYDPDTTEVDSTPAVFFEQGGGVCQDFAHATLGILRRARVPARYASGYLYDPAVEGDPSALRGAAASHAWVQAWHPELGWVGLDPTNDKLVDWQYVRVAVGRDYGDVRPLRGVFRGPGEQVLSVSVEVTRLERPQSGLPRPPA